VSHKIRRIELCTLLLTASCVIALSGSARSAEPVRELATLKGHTAPLRSAVFSPDGRIIASGSDDKTIKIWEAAAGKELATLKGHTGDIFSVVFSPDGRTLASGSWDTTIKLWDLTTGKELASIPGQKECWFSVAFSPDGKTLASGINQKIMLWDVSMDK